MKRLSVLLAVLCSALLAADTVLKPGEKFTLDLPAGKAPAGKRLIVTFKARYARPQRIGKEWYMQVAVNGKVVGSHMPPEGSGVLRLVNRTAPTFHGTNFSYTNKGLWSVVSHNKSEEIEHIYCPADYQQLYTYDMDVTDVLSDGKNSFVITNLAPGPGKNERNHTPYLLHIYKVYVEYKEVASLPDPVERSFEEAVDLPNADIAITKSQEFKVTLPPKAGYRRVLRCRSRLSYGGIGSNSNLGVRINGKDLTKENEAQLHRMLNRGAFYMGGNESIIAAGSRITVMHGPSWGPYSRHGTSPEAQKINWYYVDIDDLLNEKENTITFFNASNTGYFNERRGFKNGAPFLRVYNIAAGYVPNECATLSPARKVITRQSVESKNRFKAANYTLSVAPQGGLQIAFGKQKFFLETRFSYPKAGFNAFDCAGAVPVNPEKEFTGSIIQDKNVFTYTFAGKYYRITRQLKCADNAIHVTEKIENISNAPLGMKVSVELISDTRADLVRKNGCQLYENALSSHNYPNGNSSIFWGFNKNRQGVGFILVDDIFRVQASYRAALMGGEVDTAHLGFDTGDCRTLEYSIYINPSADYYDFVNAVRKDWKVNDKTIPAMISWNSYHTTGSMNDLFCRRVDNLGSALIIDGQEWFNARIYHREFPDLKEIMQPYIKRKDQAKALRPQVKTLLQFQKVFSWRNKFDAPDLMGDSLAKGKDGEILVYARAVKGGNPRSTYQSGEVGWYHGYHYPALGNSYYKYIMDVAKLAMDEGFGGVYFDTPNYTAINYGRFTYDRWDGITVDLNADFTIALKYTDLCLFSAEARYNIYDYITRRGGTVVLNSPPLIRKIQQMTAPVIHFSEGDREDRLAQMHFTTPVMLGQHGSNGKAAYGRRATWMSEEDYMDDMVWKVKNGILYSAYWPPRAPGMKGETICERHEWPTRDMYPITVTDIHGGWIRGKERIITVNNGKFGWDEPVKSARIRIYGKNGRMVSDNMVNADSDGKFDIKLPENGMAIIIR